MHTLPPLSGIPSARPAGWPASAWLGVGRGRTAHHFAAGYATAACGLTVAARPLRLAWLGLAGVGQPYAAAVPELCAAG